MIHFAAVVTLIVIPYESFKPSLITASPDASFDERKANQYKFFCFKRGSKSKKKKKNTIKQKFLPLISIIDWGKRLKD